MVITSATNLTAWPTLFKQTLELAVGWLLLTVMVNFVQDKFPADFYLYLGNFICFSLGAVGAAYGINKTLKATVSLTAAGKWYTYKGNSTWGDYMGLYNLMAGAFYIIWSSAIFFGSYTASDMIWKKWSKMQKDGKTLSIEDAYFYLTLCFFFGASALLVTYSIGDTVDAVAGFWNAYNTGSEGVNHDSTPVTDDAGTSLEFDSFYHNITEFMWMVTIFVYSAVSYGVGWYYFGNEIPLGIGELIGKPGAGPAE